MPNSLLSSLLAVENVADARNYLVLSITGIVSLFPLLIRAEGKEKNATGAGCGQMTTRAASLHLNTLGVVIEHRSSCFCFL